MIFRAGEKAARNADFFNALLADLAIARAARGIPRVVDRLAETSILVALRNKRTEIDGDVVVEALEEVDL